MWKVTRKLIDLCLYFSMSKINVVLLHLLSDVSDLLNGVVSGALFKESKLKSELLVVV